MQSEAKLYFPPVSKNHVEFFKSIVYQFWELSNFAHQMDFLRTQVKTIETSLRSKRKESLIDRIYWLDFLNTLRNTVHPNKFIIRVDRYYCYMCNNIYSANSYIKVIFRTIFHIFYPFSTLKFRLFFKCVSEQYFNRESCLPANK